jgi:hypothetical protein
MSRLLYLLLILPLCSCGISNKYLVTENYDQFDKVRTFTLHNNYLAAKTTEIALTNLIDLQVSKVVKPDTTLLILTVVQQGDDRFYISADTSLVMLIDGKRYGFDLLWVRHGNVERGFYGISPELFYSLAYATTVAVKIVGDDYDLERAIHPKTLERYQKFYQEILK